MTTHYDTITCQETEPLKFLHTLRKNTGMELPAKNVTNPLILVIRYTLPSPKETADTIMRNAGNQCFIDNKYQNREFLSTTFTWFHLFFHTLSGINMNIMMIMYAKPKTMAYIDNPCAALWSKNIPINAIIEDVENTITIDVRTNRSPLPCPVLNRFIIVNRTIIPVMIVAFICKISRISSKLASMKTCHLPRIFFFIF